MDHKLAESQSSVEKYTLDELSADERSQFEEHMFDCPICSDLVRQNFAVVDHLKAALVDEEQKSRQPAVHRSSWMDLFRWPSLVPTAAALAMALFIGYQNWVHPSTPELSQLAQNLPVPMEPLRPTSRGALPQIELNANTPFSVLLLNADQLPAGRFACELQTGEGRLLVSAMQGTKLEGVDLVSVPVPTKTLSAGNYQLVLHSTGTPAVTKTFAFAVRYTDTRH